MKKYSILAVLAVLLLSCGGKIKLMVLLLLMKCVNAAKKVKGLAFADMEAKKIRMECSKLQGENWGKIIRDKEQEDAFNKRLNECTDEIIDAMSK
ncbi:MAG: hypothetical protein IPL04_15690 [Chitinophagaceae bacterium]|nr:hypothetical protein [Chitinophagaceae bacterium]